MPNSFDFLKNITLGTYDPFWKSIAIHNEQINGIEKEHPEVLNNLVTFHETFHWLQLSTSSVGHLISLYPFFHKNIVSMYVDYETKDDSFFEVTCPLIDEIKKRNNTNSVIFYSDLNDINNSTKFFNDNISHEEWLDNGKEYLHALFAFYDMYLMHSKKIIVKDFGEAEYNNLVEENRHYWNDRIDITAHFCSSDLPLIGFRDLVECAARIIEIYNYNVICEHYSALNKEYKIDTGYLFHEAYFRPIEYVNKFFKDDLKDGLNNEVLEFLLLAIHISINPPLLPSYKLYNSTHSLSDIHPGMRFFKICDYVQKAYGSCITAIKTENLYDQIIEELEWFNDKAMFSMYDDIFNKFYNRIEKHDDGQTIIGNDKLYEFDFYIYNYYKYIKTKSNYTDYFINPIKQMFENRDLNSATEVDKNVHCPVLFNPTTNQYQVNCSGFSYELYNSDKSLAGEISTNIPLTDQIQQYFINVVFLSIYLDLDKQLLYDNKIDLDIFKLIDAKDSLKNDLLNIYNATRRLKLIF